METGTHTQMLVDLWNHSFFTKFTEYEIPENMTIFQYGMFATFLKYSLLIC